MRVSRRSPGFTTQGLVVNTQEHLNDVYTSDELPSVVYDLTFDYRGDIALGKAIMRHARQSGLRCEGAGNPGMTLHSPTLNLMSYLNPQQRFCLLSTGVCQTTPHERNMDFGATIGCAIQASDCSMIMLAAGGFITSS